MQHGCVLRLVHRGDRPDSLLFVPGAGLSDFDAVPDDIYRRTCIDAWWSLIFAGMATGAVGIGFWRRIGLSRLIAVAGVWGGTALIVGNGEATWPSVFAFLATAVIIYSLMRRDAYTLGIGIAVVWLASALIIVDQHDAAWISIFAFLTAMTTAGSRSRWAKGLAAIVWWGLATIIILATDGWYWLTVIAWLLASASLGFSDWHFLYDCTS